MAFLLSQGFSKRTISTKSSWSSSCSWAGTDVSGWIMPNLPPIPPANSLRDFIFIGKVSYLLTWQNGIGEARFFRADVACALLVGGLSRVSTSQGGPRFWMLVGWRNDLNLFGVFRLFMCGRWPSYVGVIMFIGSVITIASFIFNLHHQSIIFCFLFFKNNNNNKNLSPKVPI